MNVFVVVYQCFNFGEGVFIIVVVVIYEFDDCDVIVRIVFYVGIFIVGQFVFKCMGKVLIVCGFGDGLVFFKNVDCFYQDFGVVEQIGVDFGVESIVFGIGYG